MGGKPPRTRQHVHLRHPDTELNDRQKCERPLVKRLAPVGIVMTLGAEPLVIELVDYTGPAESTEDAWRAS